jgi:AraC-like DNA-binding protein
MISLSTWLKMLTIKIKIIFSVLVCATLVVGYAIANFSQIQDVVLPGQESLYPWRGSASTDADFGGGSSINVKDSTYNLNIDFNLSAAIQYPYVSFALIFEDEANPINTEDWSSYSHIKLRVKCIPENILHLALLTHDAQITKVSPDINAYRPSIAVFNCSEQWQTVSIDLNRLDTADWWLQRHNLNLANRDYFLSKVRAMTLSSGTHNPVGVPSNVMVQEIVLEGKNLPLIYALSTLVLAIWGALFGWVFYQFYLLRKKLNINPEITPMAYELLSIETKHDREKVAVLEYMASKYSNPGLSVDMAVTELGINRIKINEILRAATGLTFSIYLNKLRLAEAARLLSEKQIGVAEAAFAVGYNSLSYFDRLFKKEYGCNPSTFRNPTANSQSSDA